MLGARYVSPYQQKKLNYHVRLFARLALGAVVAHAGGLVVVFVLAAVGVFGAGGVHQGDLSPESIPKYRHSNAFRPLHLAPSPCPAAVAQKAAGPAVEPETPLTLRNRGGASVWDGS